MQLKKKINGWLIIDKEKGISSSSIVNNVKRILKCKKAGHAGTLDPDATGLLAVGLGEATKLMSYLTNDLKCYLFKVKFGIMTHSDDSSGREIKTSKFRPSNVDIENIIPSFLGNIFQKPPNISALKINGKRAYKLNHNCSNMIELESRKIFVKSLKMLNRENDDIASFQVVCGKGTYVRSIARDIGNLLGCYAHTLSIRRLWSGPFNEKDMISLKELEENLPTVDKLIKPIEDAVPNLDKISCDEKNFLKLKNGQEIDNFLSFQNEKEVLLVFRGKPIAIGVVKNDIINPRRVFNFFEHSRNF